MISLSLSLSLCLSSSRVAQSLLVPGKSPSKYGRRGSAIGIGTVEEVHVQFSLLSYCSHGLFDTSFCLHGSPALRQLTFTL